MSPFQRAVTNEGSGTPLQGVVAKYPFQRVHYAEATYLTGATHNLRGHVILRECSFIKCNPRAEHIQLGHGSKSVKFYGASLIFVKILWGVTHFFVTNVTLKFYGALLTFHLINIKIDIS